MRLALFGRLRSTRKSPQWILAVSFSPFIWSLLDWTAGQIGKQTKWARSPKHWQPILKPDRSSILWLGGDGLCEGSGGVQAEPPGTAESLAHEASADQGWFAHERNPLGLSFGLTATPLPIAMAKSGSAVRSPLRCDRLFSKSCGGSDGARQDRLRKSRERAQQFSCADHQLRTEMWGGPFFGPCLRQNVVAPCLPLTASEGVGVLCVKFYDARLAIAFIRLSGR